MIHMPDDTEKLTGREEDRKLLEALPKEQLTDLIFMHLRDMWAVDGLYFLGIEEQFGTEAATEIDGNVWAVMGKIEAKRIKKLLGLEAGDIETMIQGLRHSGWSLDLEGKEYGIGEIGAIIRNVDCRVQNTRKKKGLGEFPCKKVRWGFLKAFAREFDPDIEVKCNVCPPDPHPDGLWCEWEFVLERE